MLHGEPIVSLRIGDVTRLCLAQISSSLLKQFSYNEIHNRRVALGITCVQCTPAQLEHLRRAGAMPLSSRRCGLITHREAERLVRSFLEEHAPPALPPGFAFDVRHSCGWGCRGKFLPDRYTSSRAKCVSCSVCGGLFSPNKFIFHCHQLESDDYRHPDAANFNAWRRHLQLDALLPSDSLVHAWEDVKAMFNGGSRKRSTTGGSENAAGAKSMKIVATRFEELVPPMGGRDTFEARSSIPPPYLPYNIWNSGPVCPTMFWSKGLAWNPLVGHMLGFPNATDWRRPLHLPLPAVESSASK